MSNRLEKPIYRRILDYGRISLPHDIIREWKLEDGDYIQLKYDPDKSIVVLRPVRG